MEAMLSSETSVNYQTTLSQILRRLSHPVLRKCGKYIEGRESAQDERR
jgi:hypothetical protein